MSTTQRNRANWWFDKVVLSAVGVLSLIVISKVDALSVAVSRMQGTMDAQHVIDEVQNKRIDWIQENK